MIKFNKNAVVIIGFPQYALDSFDSLYQNIIKPNDAKVFCHIWTNGYEDKLSLIKRNMKSIGAIYKMSHQEKNSYDVSFVKGAYFASSKSGPFWDPYKIFGQFHSAKKVMDLVKKFEEENGVFKNVFKSRFDMHFLHPIIMNESINRGIEVVHARPLGEPWMFADFAFWGNSRSMHVWGQSFYRIREIYEKHKASFCPESLWSKNWELNNIKIHHHPEWKFHPIKREDGKNCNFCNRI